MTDVDIINKFIICQACGRQHDHLVSKCENCKWTPVPPVDPTTLVQPDEPA